MWSVTQSREKLFAQKGMGSVEMTGGRSPVIEIHEKVTVVHCHSNFTMFAGPPQKVTVY